MKQEKLRRPVELQRLLVVMKRPRGGPDPSAYYYLE
jgi:hypothetical protein